ncbi:MAG: hypothetical protein EZS28_026452 [Streblomastix strix]|uniref:Uncharacterized protein n=1 Tax=Streblomastix strix TaxID=222440 RepID=A0A5J4V5H1_9EUKA|nr:MAG: hypothetical protein EZS28_026452 [Streblomastix strix]
MQSITNSINTYPVRIISSIPGQNSNDWDIIYTAINRLQYHGQYIPDVLSQFSIYGVILSKNYKFWYPQRIILSPNLFVQLTGALDLYDGLSENGANPIVNNTSSVKFIDLENHDVVLQAQEDEIIFDNGAKILYFREILLLNLVKVRINLGDVKHGVVFDDIKTSSADITPLTLPPRQTQTATQTNKDQDKQQQKNQQNIQQQLQVSTSRAIIPSKFIKVHPTNTIAEKDKQEKAKQLEEQKKEEIFPPDLLSSAVSLRQKSEMQVMQTRMKKIIALTPDKLISYGYYQAPDASPDHHIPGLGAFSASQVAHAFILCAPGIGLDSSLFAL